jgi:hypothetical protein
MHTNSVSIALPSNPTAAGAVGERGTPGPPPAHTCAAHGLYWRIPAYDTVPSGL